MNLPQEIRELPLTDPVYLVGGALRDHLLGRPCTDYDLVVDGDGRAYADQVAEKFRKRVIVFGRNQKPTYRIALQDRMIDVAAMDGGSIEEDLRRRDFTVNAMAYDLRSQTLVDPWGGCDDLRARVIRLVSKEAIAADRIRMLRAFRFAATLGFDVADDTVEAVENASSSITSSSAERIRSELFQLAAVKESAPYLRRLHAVGLLTAIIPELKPCRGCTQNEIHGRDVFEHTMAAYGELEKVLEEYPVLWPRFSGAVGAYLAGPQRPVLLKWAALCHDLGKPGKRQIDGNGKVRFLGHEQESARLAGAVCKRLRMSNQEQGFVTLIVAKHLTPLFLFHAFEQGGLTPKGIVRFGRKYGDHLVGLILHGLADQRAKVGVGEERVERFRAFADHIFCSYFSGIKPRMARPRILTGDEVMRHFGLKPSKLVGKILNTLEEARLKGDIQTREEALRLASTLVEMEGDAGIEPATPSSGGLCSIR